MKTALPRDPAAADRLTTVHPAIPAPVARIWARRRDWLPAAGVLALLMIGYLATEHLLLD